MQVCVHTPKKYEMKLDPKKLPRFSHDQEFVVHPDSISNHVWNPDAGPVYWKLDTDTPDIEGINLELELFKRVFLQISMETPLVIRRRKRLTAEAQCVIVFTHEDPYFKNQGVLAYAYGPEKGIGSDITFNDSYIWTLDGKPITALDAWEKGFITGFSNPENKIKTYDAQHTGTHEGGHAFGMDHIPRSTGPAVLNPMYNGLRQFQKLDLDLLHKLNGNSNLNHRIKEYLLTKILRMGVV